MSTDLAGKIVIVTGAARGQGAAEARRFREDGAVVVAGDVLPGDGVVALDVTSAESWQAVVTATVAEHGRIDVLVNNAGIHRAAPVHEMDEGEFRTVLDVNLVGPFLGIQAVVPHMPRGGSIINVASLNGLAAQPGTSAYTSSKFALRGLTRAAALDLGRLGIRVNAVLPGVVRTPMVAYVVDEREDELAAGLPLGRIGEPTDIAAAVAFLASDQSSWMTGSDVTVDGGLMASTPRL
ncbi:MAG: SDR family oxidoreductase [Acidimicrobiales bacterium]|nr:SDR family oxidoreductase [Acidimicrobiales bacterium]